VAKRWQRILEGGKNCDMIYTAFLMGLIGSLHCIGMCGPIAMMLPADKSKQSRFIVGRILYNFGRIVTYSILGLTIGLIGEQISFLIPQKILSIFIGFLIIFIFIIPPKWQNRLSILPRINKFNNFIKSLLSVFYKKYSFISQFTFGLLNGLLPCGMVYAALSGAFLMNHAWQSMLFMTLFGIGTLPMMLSFSFFWNVVRKFFSFQPKIIFTFSYIILAILLIFRGINLPSKGIDNQQHRIPVCGENYNHNRVKMGGSKL
jgi:uncharacterized protein